MRIFTRPTVSLRLMVCLAVSLLLALPASALARSTKPARPFAPANTLKAHGSTKKAAEEAKKAARRRLRRRRLRRSAKRGKQKRRPAARRDQGDREEGRQAAGSADRLRHARGTEADRAAAAGGRAARRTHDRARRSDGARPCDRPRTHRACLSLADGRPHRRPDARSGRPDHAGGARRTTMQPSA